MKKEVIQELQKRKEELEFIKEKAYEVKRNANNQIVGATKELEGINILLESCKDVN